MHYTNYIIHYLIVLVFPELLLDKTVFDVYQQHYVVYSTVLVFLTAFLILCYKKFFDLFIHFVHLICSVNDIHDVPELLASIYAREKLVNVKALARFHGMTVLYNYYNRHLYNNSEAGFESTGQQIINM